MPATVLYESATSRTNRHWFEAFRREDREKEPAVAFPGVDAALARLRPRRRTPSGSELSTVDASQIFGRGGGVAREFGTLVHALFEEIEWSDEVNPGEWEARLRSGRFASPALEEAFDQVRGVLGTAALSEALARPNGHAETWRERNFEILLGDEWLSGTFDRVVLERDAAGRAVAATILDFKTDRLSTDGEIAAAVEKYRPQLETYREVLRRMTGLPSDAIRCRLLFTRPRALREV